MNWKNIGQAEQEKKKIISSHCRSGYQEIERLWNTSFGLPSLITPQRLDGCPLQSFWANQVFPRQKDVLATLKSFCPRKELEGGFIS
jgi:hypothetical protein